MGIRHRATNHICYNKNSFFSIHSISHVLVSLPNESQLRLISLVQFKYLPYSLWLMFCMHLHFMSICFLFLNLTTNHNCLTIFNILFFSLFICWFVQLRDHTTFINWEFLVSIRCHKQKLGRVDLTVRVRVFQIRLPTSINLV